MGRMSSSGISTMRCNHVAIGAKRLAAAPYRTRRTAPPPPSGASEVPSSRSKLPSCSSIPTEAGWSRWEKVARQGTGMGRMSSSGLRDDALRQASI